MKTRPEGYGLELEGKEQISGALEVRWGCPGQGSKLGGSWDRAGKSLQQEKEQGVEDLYMTDQ